MPPVEIETILGHRYPFLLLDRIDGLVPGKQAIGYKKISKGEFFLQTGPKGTQIFPRVLVLEAMAQTGAAAILCHPPYRHHRTLLAGIDHAHFFQDVFVGDELVLKAEITRLRGKIGRRKCQALVEGVLKAQAEIIFALT